MDICFHFLDNYLWQELWLQCIICFYIVSFDLLVFCFSFSFLLAYIHGMGGIIVPIPNSLYWLACPHPPPRPQAPRGLPHLKQLQEVSSFYFTYVYEAHQQYSLTVVSSFHHPPIGTP
jgi:hypothetical protein